MKIKNKFIICALTVLFIALSFLPIVNEADAVTVSAPIADNEGVEVAISADTKVSSRLWDLFFGTENTAAQASETVYLYEGGGVFGARVKQPYATVYDTGGIAELKCADRILAVDGKSVSSAAEVRGAVEAKGGQPVTLTLFRDGRKFDYRLTPKCENGSYKLGIGIRDGAAGIGTITYIDPETGEFGGLGHGISDADSGQIIEMREGVVTDVILGGVQKGESGKPGELCGILTDRCLGVVYTNTPMGVFGKLNTLPAASSLTKIEIGKKDTVKEGEATIRCTLKGNKTADYKVEIFDVNKTSTGTKSFKIKVTDPTLLAITGGIVRGMSGSPIIQDGKLVGAVTHVMVADPTEGYGIFIENMLNAAENTVPKAA